MSKRIRSYTKVKNAKAEKRQQYSQNDKAKNVENNKQKQPEKVAKTTAYVEPEPKAEGSEQERSTRTAEAQCVQADIGQSIQRQLAAYQINGYEPTHTVCSIIGYLIGVKEKFFLENEHSYLQKSVYQILDRNLNMRLIRLLCMLRMQVMQRYTSFEHAFFQKRRVYELIQDRVINKIHQIDEAYDIPMNNISHASDYLWKINEKLKSAVDKGTEDLQKLLPECVDAKYIKPLLLFPSTRHSAVARENLTWMAYLK